MGFSIEDFNKQRPTTATTPFADFSSGNEGSAAPMDVTAPQGNSNTISDSVIQQQKDMENAFQNGLVQQEQTPTSVTQPPGNGNATPSSGNNQSATVGNVKPTFTQQPTVDVTSTAGAADIKKIDWSKPYADIEKNSALRQMTPHDIMRDFQKNGNGDWASFMPWLQKYDPDKTVEQSEKDAEKARKQAKWEQWGNLFQHVGNFFGTAIGAPEQKVESMKDLTERQRKMREATDALRAKGYDKMMENIWKDRKDKQAQMQAEAAAKAKNAEAEYKGAQKNRLEALTPVEVKEHEAAARQHETGASLNEAKTKTENELLQPRKQKINSEIAKNNAGAADHAAGVAVKRAQVRHINSQTEGQNQKNAAGKEADNFNYNYVNDPTFKKYVNQWASHNGMAIGGNDGTGGTWANEKNRQQASKWAKAQIQRDKTPPSKRPNNGGGSKVPPSRRNGGGGGGKTPPSRR